MRPSRFTEAEITHALRQVDAGTPAVEMCRKLGITQTTFYRWRKKHVDSVAIDARGIRELRAENHKLKELVANLLLERVR